ncbi:MAG: alkaline shock response membrane anchor protein AmaP [Candidatus Omnitrophota bacterium]|nr:alkaline shock response membrane anchor protein AmaP [Candidatus Omnitrophota bacterium]
MGFLTILVYVLISFFLGGTLIGLSLNTIDLVIVFKYLQQQVLSDLFSRAILFICGALIILFCVRYIQKILYRRERSVVYESTYGRVSITLFAIEDMIRNMLESKKELTHVRVKVVPGKKAVEVIVRGNLKSEINLPEFTKEVQEGTKDKVQNLLGEEKEIKVKIEIKKMVFDGKKNIKEVEPEVPFRYY